MVFQLQHTAKADELGTSLNNDKGFLRDLGLVNATEIFDLRVGKWKSAAPSRYLQDGGFGNYIATEIT